MFLSAVPELGAADIFGVDDIDPELRGGGVTPDNIPLTVVGIVRYLAGFLYFVGVILAIYAGFLILISGGDEEKVKKGKNIITYVAIGFVVIFLAANIVAFFIDVLDPNNPADPSIPAYQDSNIDSFR